LILKDKLSSEREYAFSESRKLSLIQAVLEIFSFRLSSESLSVRICSYFCLHFQKKKK